MRSSTRSGSPLHCSTHTSYRLFDSGETNGRVVYVMPHVRRAELAVRMALGAGSRSILRLVVAEGVLTAGVGALAGVVASLSLGKVLRNQVYGVGTTDPMTLVSIFVVLAVAVVAACLAPALRAVRTDPAVVLRE